MNRSKMKKTVRSKVIQNFIIASVFSSLAFGYIVYETINNKNTVIENYKEEQQILVDEIAKESKEILQSGEQAEDFYENIVSEKVIKNAETSGSRYWIFGKNDSIIYKRNEEVTLKEKGNKFSDVQEKGYVTSIKTFEVKNNKYVVGLNTKEDYIIKMGELSNLNNSIYLFSGTLSFILIGGVLYFSLKISDKDDNIEYYMDLLKKRNIIIEESTKNVAEEEVRGNPKDDLTKVYREEILYKILDKINEQGISPVSILTFQILGLESLKDEVEKSSIIYKTSEILIEIVNDRHVIARKNNNEFVIVILESNGAEQSAFRILDKFNNQFYQLNIRLLFGISRKDGEDQEIYCVLKDSIDDLEKRSMQSYYLKERIL